MSLVLPGRMHVCLEQPARKLKSTSITLTSMADLTGGRQTEYGTSPRNRRLGLGATIYHDQSQSTTTAHCAFSLNCAFTDPAHYYCQCHFRDLNPAFSLLLLAPTSYSASKPGVSSASQSLLLRARRFPKKKGTKTTHDKDLRPRRHRPNFSTCYPPAAPRTSPTSPPSSYS